MVGHSEVTTNNIHKLSSNTKSQKAITKLSFISFISILTLASSLNIFNIIASNIQLKRKDFAVLRSIGMNNKQLNKMIFLEGLFYGASSLIYGISISLCILYMIYLKLINIKLYKFIIPWRNIFICIICVYLIIFISIWYSKRNIKNKNIIEEIRNEIL